MAFHLILFALWGIIFVTSIYRAGRQGALGNAEARHAWAIAAIASYVVALRHFLLVIEGLLT